MANLLHDLLFCYSTFLLTVGLGSLVSGFEVYENGCGNFPTMYLGIEFHGFFRLHKHTDAALLDMKFR